MKKYSTVLIVLLGVLSQSSANKQEENPEESLIEKMLDADVKLSKAECQLLNKGACNSDENWKRLAKALEHKGVLMFDEHTIITQHDLNEELRMGTMNTDSNWFLCDTSPTPTMSWSAGHFSSYQDLYRAHPPQCVRGQHDETAIGAEFGEYMHNYIVNRNKCASKK